MTTPDEYVPSEDEMISGLVQIPGEPAGIYRHVRVDEMKRGLARVRRDAAREAIDAYIAYETDGDVADDIEVFRDTHYPEETP